MQANINAYEQKVFENQFKNTSIYQKLCRDFDEIDFAKQWTHRFQDFSKTPRQEFGERRSIFSAVPFYYLQFLQKENPSAIYDLGCGWNIFKKYIPTVIGIGAEQPENESFFADIHDFVDDDFVKGHQDFFDSVFSINALHFRPLSDLKKCVDDFYSMLRVNGIGWLSLNIARMIEKDDEKFGDKDQTYLETYVRKVLFDLRMNYLVFDLDLAVLNEWMNGNIRLVIQKAS